MSLSPHDVAELRKIVSIAKKILAKASAPNKRAKTVTSATKRRKNARRKARGLVAFRKTVLAERKRRVPVAEITRKRGITPHYIYQIT